MSKPVIRAGIAAVVVVVLAVAFYLIRPYFVDEVVDEAFPGGDVTAESGADAVGEAFPLSDGAVVPDDMTQEDVEAEMEAAAAETVEEVEDMPDGEPTAIVNGSFVGADSVHQGSGSATVYELADGSRVLRLEDFEVTNGPDLHVYLAPVVDGTPQINADAVDLGSLKGNVGNQNYDVPDDLDLGQELAVVIWCQPFQVTFATAALG
ncbi:DM13 domain-containing protein [Euzebya rosea]|uniref:DM13 domain-containing protein n=1 Tax=Euzebya rosea TaxID=2052804 RepID=UPI000D3E3DC8|nr:DM13 domain-containing protein [Euzebya rosea]